jgi:hypothetical protein
MSQFFNFPISILVILTIAKSHAAYAAGPSGALNDTGQTRCLNAAGTALEACSTANSGDASLYPRQDGRFGRDPAANSATSGFSKPAGSGGSGGFAFTPLDVNGNAIALTGNPPMPSATPRCVLDRVTNLIWEVKSDDGGLQDKDWTYARGPIPVANCLGGSSLGSSPCKTSSYIAALNSASVCSVAGAGLWRLPTRRELLSIVDHGRASPAIDTGYFPNTQSSFYWSANVDVSDPQGTAWGVYFSHGITSTIYQSAGAHVRLVRSGP